VNDESKKDDVDDDEFLPETDQGTDDGEMHISPALRALMAK
jgi:chromosome transmission fidelity protein 1